MSRIKTIRIGKRTFKVVAFEINETKERAKIPTTFVPLSPERIPFNAGYADLLCGLFHIMWSDMPRPATYSVKLADVFSSSGEYVGSRLECLYPNRTDYTFETR